MHACPRALFTPFALRRPRTPFPSLFDLFDVIYYDVLWPRGIRMGIIFHGTTEDVTTRTVTSTVTAREHASLNTQAGWIECTRPEHTTLFWYISAAASLSQWKRLGAMVTFIVLLRRARTRSETAPRCVGHCTNSAPVSFGRGDFQLIRHSVCYWGEAISLPYALTHRPQRHIC